MIHSKLFYLMVLSHELLFYLKAIYKSVLFFILFFYFELVLKSPKHGLTEHHTDTDLYH